MISDGGSSTTKILNTIGVYFSFPRLLDSLPCKGSKGKPPWERRRYSKSPTNYYNERKAHIYRIKVSLRETQDPRP